MSLPDLDGTAKQTRQTVETAGTGDGKKPEDNRLQVDELSLLQEASLAISSSLELEKVLEIITRSVLQLTSTEIATVFLVGQGGEVTQAITVPPEKSYMRTPPRTEGLTKLLIETRKPVIIPDTLDDRRVNPDVIALGIRSLLGMPLMIGSDVVGVLYLNSLSPHHFTSYVVSLLAVLTNQMAIALRNASLYAEVVREKEKLAAIFQHSTDGILIVDQQKTIVEVNPGFANLTGWDASQAIGRQCSEILGCSDLLGGRLCEGNCPLDRALIEGMPIPHIEATIMSKDGKSVDIAASCSLVPQPSGEAPLLVCFLRDFTELKRAERVKSDFVSTISHELRTPLSIIKGYTSTLLRPDLFLPEEQKQRFLQNVDRASNRLVRLIDDLLSVSRMEGGQLDLKLQHFDLRDTIVKVVGEHQDAEIPSHHITLRMPKSPLFTSADPIRIEEVLHNLLDNAIKYSPEGSTVKVEARRVRRDNREFANKLPSVPFSLVVSVTDSGIGITNEQATHIFEKFYRGETGLARRTRGLGVGLYLSKGLVEAHGGKIWVKSEPDRGSTFYFSLPAARE